MGNEAPLLRAPRPAPATPFRPFAHLAMFQALRPILNKGGAGRYISRAESAERLVPVAARHLDLLDAYAGARSVAGDAAAPRLDGLLSLLRTEIGKIYETLFSLGGNAPTGAGRTAVPPAGDTDVERVEALIDAERDFGAALSEESEAVHHQERTRAILMHNAARSGERLDALRALAADLR